MIGEALIFGAFATVALWCVVGGIKAKHAPWAIAVYSVGLVVELGLLAKAIWS